jgi:hypothetical protein
MRELLAIELAYFKVGNVYDYFSKSENRYPGTIQ